MDGLGQSVRRSASWTFLGRGVSFVVTLGTSIVLARLLDPADYGVFGIAMIFTALTSRFTNFGFGMALIQRKEVSKDHVSTLFVVNLLLFSAATGLLLSTSSAIGRFFANPLVGDVLAVLSFRFLIYPFSTTATAVLKRRMAFRAIAIAGMLSLVVSSTVSIVMALNGYSVWSLVWGNMAGMAVDTVSYVLIARWVPVPRFRWSAFRDLSGFGVRFFAKGLLTYMSEKIVFFIVGKRLGSTPLGIFEKAFDTVELFVKEFGRRFFSILFSAFSKIQDDRDRMRHAFLKLVVANALLLTPLFAGLWMVAPHLLRLLYGEKWVACVPIVRVLCAAGLARSYLLLADSLLNGVGDIGYIVRIRALSFVLLGIGSWLACEWDAEAVAWVVSAVSALGAGLYIRRVAKAVDMKARRFLTAQYTTLIGTAVMLGALALLYSLLIERWVASTAGRFLLTAGLGAVVYGAFVWYFASGQLRALLDELNPLHRWRSRRARRRRELEATP